MGTPLDPKRDHRISLAEAAALTRRYREGGPRRKGDSGAFVAAPVIELLTQKGCEGLRIYQARDAAGDATFVLVGVDGNGNDMTDGIVLEQHYPCPPYCPDTDQLNS